MGTGLYFSSNIDKGYENDLARMTRKTNKFSANTKKQGSKIDHTFRNITRTVGGLGVLMGTIAAGKEMINFSKNLETSLIEVATISKDVTENFQEYKKALIELSTQEDLAASSADDLAKAYYDVVSAGYDGAEGMQVLEASARAGTAGFVEVGTAADGITTVLNAWGKSASEAANVSDIFFKTVEKGKTTFPELGSNIAQVAPLAAAMNVSFEEVSGAIATITKQGTPTSQALTQIRSALIAMDEQLGQGWASTMTLQEGFVALADKAESTGVAVKDITGRVEGALAVLATTGKNAKGAAKDLDSMSGALGSTAKAAWKVTQTTGHQTKLLKNNILAALEPLGASGIAQISKFATKLNSAFSRKLIRNIEDERIEVNSLVIQLKDANISEETREKVLNRLKILAPDVNKVLKDETKSLGDLNIVLETYNKQMALKVLMAEQDIRVNKQRGKTDDFSKMQAERQADLLKAIVSSAEWLKQKLPNQIKEIDAILNDATTETVDKAEALFQKTFESGGNVRLNYILGKSIANFNILKDMYAFENKSLEDMIKDADKLIEDYKKILGVSVDVDVDGGKKGGNGGKGGKEGLTPEEIESQRQKGLRQLEINYQKELNFINAFYSNEKKLQLESLKTDLTYLKKKKKLTIDELKKLAIDRAIIEKNQQLKALNTQEETTDESLRKLDIEHQKKINQLTEQYGNEEKAQKELNKELILEDIRYFAEKAKLTDDELEKLVLNYKKIQKELELGKGGDGKGDGKKDEGISSSFEEISNAFSSTGDNLTNQLADLSTNVVSAFETLNNELSTPSSKISGIVSLIKVAGDLIKDVVNNAYTKEAENQSDINNEIAKRISSEEIINRLVRERTEMELNSSAFLDANYKDQYSLALQTLKDSSEIVDSSLSALSGNFLLTATGKGKSWLGINKVAEEYSFTLDQIINKSDTLSGVELGGTISNILDPADIFGGAASGKAYEDALNKVESAFNSTLKSMGKTSSDMANFSKEDWVEFYTILDEGGYIVDEGTKSLVNGMREAQEAYTQALEDMKNIISTIAGDLGTALGDSIVDAVANGTDALDDFEKSLNKVFLEMAKAEMNALFFQGMFDQLQTEMEESMAGGDQDWQDDLLRFYEKLPSAIEGAESFMTDFDQQLKDLGFEGIRDGGSDTNLSTAGQISQSITEKTGTILAGHFGAVRLSNERIYNNSEEMLDLGVQNLVTLNKIKENTDYLPEIAANTKKTAKAIAG